MMRAKRKKYGCQSPLNVEKGGKVSYLLPLLLFFLCGGGGGGGALSSFFVPHVPHTVVFSR